MAGRPGYGLIFTKFIKMCIEKGGKTDFSRVLSLPRWFEATEKSYGFGLFSPDGVLRLRCQNTLFSMMDEC